MQIIGGSGSDTITATNFTFSAEQRNAIFANSSVEKIVDLTDTYIKFAPTITVLPSMHRPMYLKGGW